eukprot:TRINITY_DN2622_c0_g1_i2.p1 TRINITY_DN2622_c0_g1~~TRINITY_DN2622_c0_g1_i2.p1  ORF type:complete len:165 (-),score=34.78 TRINITY_DN2622_c0_g1_i2:211-654(-)
MFSLRSRMLGRLAAFTQSALVESVPKVAAVRLIHLSSNVNHGFLVKPELAHPAWRDHRIVKFSSSALTQGDVEARVLTVCKAFDKINADKVSLTAHFINDLGLDSLDHVEVIMAMEDEFGFEIPDEHAERLTTPESIVKYVLDHEDA